MKAKIPIKAADILIILMAAGVTGFSAFSVYAKSNDDRPQVTIHGNNQHWIFPLEAEETVYVKGTLGDTVVRIQNNLAWVESSPCENQTCVGMGKVNFK